MKNNIKKFLFISFLAPFSLAYGEITVDVLEKMFKQHCSQLKNTHIQQKPFIITFSGTPGMGKSRLAQKLEDVYQAVRISTDTLRALFNSSASIELKEYDEALQKYFAYFFKRYSFPNKRMILDASIDRKYARLFPFFQLQNIEFVVVRLEVPRDVIVKRLIAREGDRAYWYLKHLDAWLLDYDNFAQQYKNYISYENLEESDLKNLTDEIDKNIIKP